MTLALLKEDDSLPIVSTSSITSYGALEQEFKQNQAWGVLTSVDLSNCNPMTLRSADAIKQYVIELCDLIDMKRFGETIVVHFGEDEKVAGYSMTQLIETSLISGHFANLTNSAYIDIFSCKLYDPFTVARFTQEFFNGDTPKIHIILRK